MMLETPKGYQFSPPDTITSLEYKISVNDFVNFRLFANDGLRLVDFTNVGENNNSSTNFLNSGIDYVVDIDGTVKLPIVGKIMLAGFTIREAIKILEEKYSSFYVKPYVLVKVTNRRVIVFPGGPGTAKVIPLINNNTTLFEAIALAGGISEDGKAREVKLIRGNPDKPQVFLIDLSTIYGIKAGSMVLQANDIIYVTPQRRIALALLDRLTPVLSVLTTLLSIFLTVLVLESTRNSQ